MGIASGAPGRGRRGMGSGSLIRRLTAWYGVAVALTVAAVTVMLVTFVPHLPGRDVAGLAWSLVALAAVLVIRLRPGSASRRGRG